MTTTNQASKQTDKQTRNEAGETMMIRNHTFLRSVSAVTLCAFMSLSMYPLTAAAQAHDAAEKAGTLRKQKDEGVIGNAQRYLSKLAGNYDAKPAATSDDRLGQLLNDIHENLKAVVPETAFPSHPGQSGGSKKSTLSDADVTARVASIRGKTAEIKALNADIEQSFKDTEKRLRDANLPQEILDRHNVAVLQYQNRKAEFERLTTKVEQASDSNDKTGRQTALADLGAFMAKYPNAKRHQYGNPNKLPFGTNSGKVREPYTTASQFQVSLFPPKYKKVMLAGAIPDGLQLAQATLPQIPDAPDLAETEDVQITQAIKDQATALNNNPVKIYNWVRNNIAFIPSYGSIQGSEMTLQNKRGNAFDTASLLIAMYRAAGIPARYVYGTIEVPADKAMNWVGGVTKAEAAQSLLGQGGIPSVGLISGGAIKAIRMEHVWVEAFVDNLPSRGAINKRPNTWVPMDASFKQYQFSSSLDVSSNVPFDAQQFLDKMKQGATIDELAGSVRGIDAQKVDAAIAEYNATAKSFVDSKIPNASLLDVVGGQQIVQESSPILLGSLPYALKATGSTFQKLPDSLRHYVDIELYQDDFSKAYGAVDFSYRVSFPVLAGKRFTLSYDPASDADKSALLGYLDANGRSTAKWITSYLIRVKPVLRLDGIVVKEGAAVALGQDEVWDMTLSSPSLTPNTATNIITAGSYTAIVPNYAAVSPEQLKREKYKAAATQVKLNARSAELTKDDFTGELLYVAGLGYWSLTGLSNRLAAKAQKMVSYQLQTLGLFSQDTKVLYRFGIPYSATMGGMSTDIDFNLRSVVSNGTSDKAVRNFMIACGLVESFLEGTHWELTLKLPTTGGISASHLLEVAARNNIDIFSISSVNASTALPQLTISADAKQEISDAVASGKVVIVPRTNISTEGWTGSAYIILDDETGSAAYKINGGLNGGEKSCQCYSFSPLEEFIYGMIITAIGLAFPLLAVIIGIVFAALSTYLSLCAVDSADGLTQSQKDMMKGAIYGFGAISAALAVVGLFATGATIGVLIAVSVILIIASNIITSMLIDLFTSLNNRPQP